MLEEKRSKIAAGEDNIIKDEKGMPVADAEVGLLDSEKAKGLLGDTLISKFRGATAG